MRMAKTQDAAHDETLRLLRTSSLCRAPKQGQVEDPVPTLQFCLLGTVMTRNISSLHNWIDESIFTKAQLQLGFVLAQSFNSTKA